MHATLAQALSAALYSVAIALAKSQQKHYSRRLLPPNWRGFFAPFDDRDLFVNINF